jgi:hypothetical protein
MKSARLLAVALLCALMLSACKPPGGAMPPVPEKIPTGTPTASSVSIEPPSSIIDLACSSLLDELAAGSLFSTDMALVNPAETITGVDHVIPHTFAVQQLGGLACEISNGHPQSANVALEPDYRGILLTLLPISPQQYSTIPDYPSGTSYCTDDAMPYCEANSFELEGWWLSITVSNADGVSGDHEALTALTALTTRALERIATAPPSGSEWAAPTGTITVPVHCEELLQPSTLADILDLSESLEYVSPSGPGDVTSTAFAALNAPGCGFVYTNTYFGEAYLDWLPGGEWAWQQQSGFESIIASNITSLDVPGLLDGDGAWERCDHEHICVIDLLVGHNWVELVRDPETKTKLKKHDANLAIATALYRALRY